MVNQKSVWQILGLSGAVGILLYFAHVFIGGALWQGYNPITQTISELTGTGAPNASFLRVLTTAYGIFVVFYSFFMYFTFKNWQLNKIARIGAILLIIMELTSLIGYGLFPLDMNKSMARFQNLMHIVVTVVVVVTTLGSVYCIAIGLKKSPGHKMFGAFILICAVIITVAGLMTPVTMANNFPMAGLVERINIFTLQIWLFVSSIYLFSKKAAPVAA